MSAQTQNTNTHTDTQVNGSAADSCVEHFALCCASFHQQQQAQLKKKNH